MLKILVQSYLSRPIYYYAANLSYDTKVFPDNCRATANLDGYDIILWNNGLQSQEVKAGVTSGTVNAVVEALITDQ